MPFSDIPPDRPVLIAGPTASGKSALAETIVAQAGGVIVNADALLPHRLYGHVGRKQPYSTGH